MEKGHMTPFLESTYPCPCRNIAIESLSTYQTLPPPRYNIRPRLVHARSITKQGQRRSIESIYKTEPRFISGGKTSTESTGTLSYEDTNWPYPAEKRLQNCCKPSTGDTHGPFSSCKHLLNERKLRTWGHKQSIPAEKKTFEMMKTLHRGHRRYIPEGQMNSQLAGTPADNNGLLPNKLL